MYYLPPDENSEFETNEFVKIRWGIFLWTDIEDIFIDGMYTLLI